MSYSPVPLPGAAPLSLRARPGFPLRPYQDIRPARPAVLTRRYEISWLGADGSPQSSTRLAPATAPFEEAFSAFARGTLIQTAQGFVSVEDLVPGMELPVAEGGTRTLVWMGSMTVYPTRAVPEAEPVTLTRVMADAFGAGRPMPDLVLGPRARLLVRDARARAFSGRAAVYAPARAFRDGETAITVTPMASMAVYNLALSRQGSIRAAGLDVESYHPGTSFAETIEPQMGGLFLSLFPHVSGFGDFGPMAHPRLTLEETEEMLAT
ncbi:MAG: Hint domain-containing protein [Paracoccaceae bacterium]